MNSAKEEKNTSVEGQDNHQACDILPHDPDRFETTDFLGNPDVTNGMRAAYAEKALIAFQNACHMDDEPTVATADLICDLLHLVHSLGCDPMDCVSNALEHFKAEAGR